mmetsp:Transcript_15330/g.22560  ORF Transcript_15330/g.22560 Transcript_15330/m.22560 type:complete len:146 (+) Transcript_15330:77-514(+)|eukprot:CAMPEP_0195518286 /NCGR_PEP_ID=MMETSP0794_2-20130614/12661_1 /TAXON_ID=515487 /ORGANISM="Stephanopyxis turris, Strain CCMP 815" /LENGTH=145 /DNA_ID=CAMNT_0040647229 /DNA_START=76 /DNA_END=513 /DNA_ORIENTATION=-
MRTYACTSRHLMKATILAVLASVAMASKISIIPKDSSDITAKKYEVTLVSDDNIGISHVDSIEFTPPGVSAAYVFYSKINRSNYGNDYWYGERHDGTGQANFLQSTSTDVLTGSISTEDFVYSLSTMADGGFLIQAQNVRDFPYD